MAKYCSNCGKAMADGEVFCSSCGYNTSSPSGNRYEPRNGDYVGPNKKKSPGVSVLLSFFLCGLGQLYNGKIAKGLLFMFVFIPFTILLFFSVIVLLDEYAGIDIGIAMLFILLISIVVIWVYNLYDAYSDAKEYNVILYRTGIPPW